MKRIFIYTLSHPITKEIRYLGKTNNLEKRFRKHINESIKSTSSHKKAWINSLLKLNLKPIIEIIDTTDYNNWKSSEQYWSSQLKSWGFNLTNQTNGGDGVDIGNIPWNKGLKGVLKPNSSSFKKGNMIGEETRFVQGNIIGEETRFGKENIPWNKGISNKKLYKPIIQYDLNGNFIKEYNAIKSAKEETNITTISNNLNNRTKTAGGYIWKYKNNNEKQ